MCGFPSGPEGPGVCLYVRCLRRAWFAYFLFPFLGDLRVMSRILLRGLCGCDGLPWRAVYLSSALVGDDLVMHFWGRAGLVGVLRGVASCKKPWFLGSLPFVGSCARGGSCLYRLSS